MRVEWPSESLPTRAGFKAAVEEAYGSIELPYFPSAAWVEVEVDGHASSVEAAEPQDEYATLAGRARPG